MEEQYQDVEQVETPESVPGEEQVAEQPQPKYLTEADLTALREQITAQVKAEAAEHGRRSAQSWLDKHNQRQAERQTAAYKQADAMLAEVKDSIAEEDQPVIRDRMARKLMESAPAPEPEDQPDTQIAAARVQLVDTLAAVGIAESDPSFKDLDYTDPANHAKYPTQAAWMQAVYKAAESKRHNPTKQTARDPMVVGMGSGGATSQDALMKRYEEACQRGDWEEEAKLSRQIK